MTRQCYSLGLLFVAVCSSLVVAQQFTSQPQQPAPQQQMFTLRLSSSAINVVQQGLLQLRGADMIDTYAAIANQVAEQTKKPDQKPADGDPQEKQP